MTWLRRLTLPLHHSQTYDSIKRPAPLPVPKRQVPVGVGHIYDVMIERLAEQSSTVDRIDSKAAILIGFLAVFLIGVVSVPHTVFGIPYSRLAVVILLGLAIISGLVALRPRGWHIQPNPDEYVRYESWTREQAQTDDLDGAYASVVINDDLRELKIWWFNACILLVTLAVTVFVISATVQIVRTQP